MQTRGLCGLLALSAIIAVGLDTSAETVCSAWTAADHAQVVTSGYVTHLEVSHSAYANFDVEDACCQLHVYWNFPGSPPSWLRNGAYIEAVGEYWHDHPKCHCREIVATSASLATPVSYSDEPHATPDAWTIVPWGAAGVVGGSCYQVTVAGSTILIDCGSFMNTDDMPSSSEHDLIQDCDPFPFDPRSIDDLIVTHAHDDHAGRIHYLVAQGFSGDIHMTEATAEIYRAKLDDTLSYSCLPREQDAWIAERIQSLIVEHPYLDKFDVTAGISATFVNAGHIPGSASIVLTIDTPGGPSTVTFSGDIGSGHHPFLNPPDVAALRTTETTTLVVESTYGAELPRGHPADPYGEFYAAVHGALDNGKLVVIPTFALDRPNPSLRR